MTRPSWRQRWSWMEWLRWRVERDDALLWARDTRPPVVVADAGPWRGVSLDRWLGRISGGATR